MRCTVFGTGYLGATHAAGMAELGHEVLGVDIDPGKVAKLAGGEIPFYEPGLRKMLSDNLAAGRLHFTTDYDAAVEFADVHFLGVGTPQKKGEYGADLRHVHAVIDTLVPKLRRSAVIVGKSTVPVGTASELGARARGVWPPTASTSKSPGTRSFSVRASLFTTPCIPIAWCSACSRTRLPPRRPCASCMRPYSTRACRSC